MVQRIIKNGAVLPRLHLATMAHSSSVVEKLLIEMKAKCNERHAHITLKNFKIEKKVWFDISGQLRVFAFAMLTQPSDLTRSGISTHL